MVDVKEDLDRRRVHGLAEHVGVVAALEVHARMVAEVERLHDHHQVVGLEHFGAPAQHLDGVGVLVALAKAGLAVAEHHRHPGGVDALGHLDGRLQVGLEVVLKLLLSRDEGALAEGRAEVADEDAHAEAQALHGLGDTQLLLHGTIRHLVVLQAAKPLGSDELQLLDQIPARRVPEHPEVRGIVQLKGLTPGSLPPRAGQGLAQ